jgi:hypothetical protein
MNGKIKPFLLWSVIHKYRFVKMFHGFGSRVPHHRALKMSFISNEPLPNITFKYNTLFQLLAAINVIYFTSFLLNSFSKYSIYLIAYR